MVRLFSQVYSCCHKIKMYPNKNLKQLFDSNLWKNGIKLLNYYCDVGSLFIVFPLLTGGAENLFLLLLRLETKC